MKRILCLLLCAVMLCPVLVSCTRKIEGDGAIFEAYVASETFCFDPTFVALDDNSAQYLSLIFEGLTKIGKNGKLEYALLDHYKYTKDDLRNEYKLTFYLKNSMWSDASAVTADDFLYSWKRLLSPDVSASAASLLYDVKNARAAKNSECSIDDVGISSINSYTLEVIFDHDIDVDAFLRVCASIQLVPLRETAIERNELTVENWAKRGGTLSVNGPFRVVSLDYATDTLTLQRNNFYLREDDHPINKYVEPYRIVVNFVKNDNNEANGEDLNAQLERFLNGETLFIGDLPLDKRAEYAKKGTVTESLSTMSLLINVNNSLLSSKDVRTALSLAIDREELAKKVVFADAATGLINNKVFDATTKNSFRKVGGALISTKADVDAAKAKASSGSFTLTYKNTEEFAAVAEYLKSAWEAVGFTVKLNPVMSKGYNRNIDDQDLRFYNDELELAVRNGDFEVALLDFSMISTDAFATLAQFALGFTGNTCDFENDWAVTGHVSGYNSAAYNEAIEKAYAEKDYAARVKQLHECEKLLLEELPIIPLLFNKNFYMYSKELKDITHDYYGNVDLKEAYYKNYVQEVEE